MVLLRTHDKVITAVSAHLEHKSTRARASVVMALFHLAENGNAGKVVTAVSAYLQHENASVRTAADNVLHALRTEKGNAD